MGPWRTSVADYRREPDLGVSMRLSHREPMPAWRYYGYGAPR